MVNSKSGYIAILGAPNAGKSTLLNSILEEKLAAVSAKPQTTRKRFLGIYTTKTCQMIFLDTPGIHSSDKQLNQFMHQEVMEAITDADVLVFLVSLDQELSEELVRVHQWVQKKFPEKKRILVTNKVDLSHVTPATLSAVGGFGQAGAQGLDSRFPESRVAGSRGGNDLGRVILRGQEVIVHFSRLENIPISSLTGEGIPDLLKKLEEFLSEGQAFYPEEDLTTENMRSIVAEIIREKAFENLHEEIPYGLAVEVVKFKEAVGAGSPRPEPNGT